MPRYLVIEGDGWEPDFDFFDVDAPEEAIERFVGDSPSRQYDRERKRPLIVAEVKIDERRDG